MLTVTDLTSVLPNGRVLWSGLQLNLKNREIVCLTGPNGSGKTTLMHRLKDALAESGLYISMMEQQEFQDPVESRSVLSPGQSRSARIFRILHESDTADAVFFDEPGNLLDDSSLNKFLTGVRALSVPVLIISHDPRILRRADLIWHLENGKMEIWGAGYENYVSGRQKAAADARASFERSRKEIKKAMHDFQNTVRKQEKRQTRAAKHNEGQKEPKAMIRFSQNRADRTEARIQNSHSRKAESLSKRQEELRAQMPGEGRQFYFDSEPQLNRSPEILLESRGLVLTAGGRVLNRKPLNFQIQDGMRVLLSGPNGSGKSTLLRLIEDPSGNSAFIQKGTLSVYRNQIGHFRQITSPDSQEKVIDFHKQYTDRFTDAEIRIMLARAGFRGDEVFRKTVTLSGGEKTRLNLARAAISGARLLLLDEPENDLDDLSRHSLAEALRTGSTALLIVSHNPEFTDLLDIHEKVSTM